MWLSSRKHKFPSAVLSSLAVLIKTVVNNARYRVEYSESPFHDEIQALTISCEAEQEVQVITTNASVIAEVQIIHLKMDDDFAVDYPGSTVYEMQASLFEPYAAGFNVSRTAQRPGRRE